MVLRRVGYDKLPGLLASQAQSTEVTIRFVAFDGSTFTGNKGGPEGGAVAWKDLSLNTSGPEILGTRNCVFARNEAGTGGAFHIDNVGATVILQNVTAHHNVAGPSDD